jgi:transposase
MSKTKERRKRRSFTPEFKAEAVRLCGVGDRTISEVARDLDLLETSLREWIKRAAGNVISEASAAVTSSERDELRELRRRVKHLEMEREILKKAAAFFAKESE